MKKVAKKNKKLINAMTNKDCGVCDLAMAVGVQPSAISMYRTGYRHPKPNTRREIEEILGEDNLFTVT